VRLVRVIQWCGGSRSDANADRGFDALGRHDARAAAEDRLPQDCLLHARRPRVRGRASRERQDVRVRDGAHHPVHRSEYTQRLPRRQRRRGLPHDRHHRPFAARSSLGLAGQGRDADPNYGHGAEPSSDGTLVFLSYWDSGFIALDVSNPANPVFKGRTIYPANADGDAHLSNYDDAFRTPNSLGTGSQGSGDFVIHNPFVAGTDVYISWYSDGVRVVDASNPAAPKEVAHFVPPAGQNPVKPSQCGTLSQTPQVWGVVVDNSLVYASDMNTGLWVLRRTP
jgi:hypothetical protein